MKNSGQTYLTLYCLINQVCLLSKEILQTQYCEIDLSINGNTLFFNVLAVPIHMPANVLIENDSYLFKKCNLPISPQNGVLVSFK